MWMLDYTKVHLIKLHLTCKNQIPIRNYKSQKTSVSTKIPWLPGARRFGLVGHPWHREVQGRKSMGCPWDAHPSNRGGVRKHPSIRTNQAVTRQIPKQHRRPERAITFLMECHLKNQWDHKSLWLRCEAMLFLHGDCPITRTLHQFNPASGSS